MENKKQLIIIPPMSEAVKKLHEVLEGIAADENMEITLIDDLKELTQFVNNTGQCLILASNAKKCASFLQENRHYLLRNHCKTILFTPKEIPAKTLVKFTKIGLTESILESSPPKTFLYKVKLLLRSIKTAKPAVDTEQVVKSLEQKAKEEVEVAVKEKAIYEENVIDMERADKKEQIEGEAIDYGNPLKGKIKPVEESLDTHWKSNLKKSDAVESADENERGAIDSQQASIDMYMRGKNKKVEDEPEEDDFDKKMAELLAAEEAKKKSLSLDIIDEGSMKEKRLAKKAEEALDDEPKKARVELDLEAADKKATPKDIVPDDGMDDFDRKMAELMAAEEERKRNAFKEEDLGGHLTGKVSLVKPVEEDDYEEEKKEYDNSEIEEREKDVELDLLEADKKKSKKDIEAPPEDDDIHEGEVDHLEGNMSGDAGTADKIRTRMEGRGSRNADEPEEDSDDDRSAKRKPLAPKESDNKDPTSLDLEKEEPAEREKRKALRTDPEEKDYKEKAVELELAPADKEEKEKRADIEAEERERKAPTPQAEAEARERKPLEKAEEAQKRGREFEPVQELEKNSEKNHRSAQVDKIDTYYRGGEGFKKKDQDWSNLLDKNNTLDLIPGKEKKAEQNGVAKSKIDLGEQTIDYRKMKEEFDLIGSGKSASDAALASAEKNSELNNDEDAGSFKVQEIDPKSLDFAINIIDGIYKKDIKSKELFALLTDELINSYHCYPIFYTYKLSDKKFTEAFNAFTDIRDTRISEEKRAFWNEFKKDTALFERFQEKSMTTWRCPEILNNNEAWEDVELPSWAEQELKSKKVELIFPYFDGIDRMGLGIILFPEGLDPKTANGLLTVLEMARTLFLDTIQRYQVQPIKEGLKSEEAPIEEKKNVLSFFGGLFGKKKAG